MNERRGQRGDELKADEGRILRACDCEAVKPLIECLRPLSRGEPRRRPFHEGAARAVENLRDRRGRERFVRRAIRLCSCQRTLHRGIDRSEYAPSAVPRAASVVDCGKVLSARTARSQVLGGLVWGIGACLREASVVDPRFGGFLNANIAEYRVAVSADIGYYSVDFIDEPDFTFNAVGAKGLGEVALVGVTPAIANAIYHATGRRFRTLPIRLDDLHA